MSSCILESASILLLYLCFDNIAPVDQLQMTTLNYCARFPSNHCISSLSHVSFK